MNGSHNTHPCAVCTRRILKGQLMCLPHWKLVPQEQQRAVLRTWGAFSRAKSATRALEHRKDYLTARDAAVATVQAAITQTATNSSEVTP